MVIVRSSAHGEDSLVTAMAGVHESIGEIPAADATRLLEAINSVIASYSRHRAIDPDRDQVLIQNMISPVSMSGVVFTQDLNTGGPYVVINYDDESGRTDTITSGSDQNRTLLVHRGHSSKLKSPRFIKLMKVVEEIEQIAPDVGLDIEFAVDKNEEVYVFQVRRLTTQKNWSRGLSQRVELSLNEVRLFLMQKFQRAPHLFGDRTIFGMMPDWNPAEMIGVTPRSLSASLYHYLITDSVWADSRAEMGYRAVTAQPLMVNLAGRVYIDVRCSFNSFLPAQLPDSIGEKLVNHWIDRLASNKELHDKVEFDVAITIRCLSFDRISNERLPAILDNSELKNFEKCLLDLTNNIIGDSTVIQRQLQKLSHMEESRQRLINDSPQIETPINILRHARLLLNNCREYGTHPFSILARCGFIGESFLRSLVVEGYFTPDQASAFRSSARTVLSEFLEAVRELQQGNITREAFFGLYGHLRPGTYDVLSPRYDQRNDIAGPLGKASQPLPAIPFSISQSKIKEIDTALSKIGYTFKSEQLFTFIRESIAARELAKFQFSHSLSDSLELIANWGSMIGLTREELSHVPLDDILRTTYQIPADDLESHIRQRAAAAEDAYATSQGIRLPYLICEIDDLDIVPLLKSHPNFVTNQKIRAEIQLVMGTDQRLDLHGKVVLIESADPGFDWIFLRDIAGLVTKFGGANSHMAIRCAEMNIPAAIGCGEQIFDLLTTADFVLLDCASEILRPTL